MEKHRPHHHLCTVKRLVQEGRVSQTKGALRGAEAMGLDVADICRVISSLDPRDFYKSMTTFGDHRIWQDVYRPRLPQGPVYLKLTVVDELLVVSFKEL